MTTINDTHDFRLMIRELLETALSLAGGTKSRLSRVLGIRYSTVCSWFRGSIPTVQKIERLEDFCRSAKDK